MNKNISTNRLNNIFCNIMSYNDIFKDIDYVLVQGDTTTACAIALSAFNNEVKVIHLEAGLRSGDLKDPFPEEMNRQTISRIADIHLCPTESNKDNLLKENVSGAIHVVGNTGLDNISKEGCEYKNQVLITMHRRDNHHNMDKWFEELEKIANKYNDIEFLIPLHPNPNVQKHKHIFNKVKVVAPMCHNDLIEYVKKCKFVISDSGGLQEECSYLNKKIIVCRKTNDRPESIGTHSFMCGEPESLINLVSKINENYHVDAECPYGDGNSWKKIINILNNNILNKLNSKISFNGRQILDSRGNPTLEVDVLYNNKLISREACPSGSSTGSNEAIELRDNNNEYSGKGVKKAIENVEKIVKYSQYHGGQDNNINVYFKEDFSVTTNMLGSNKKGLEFIKENVGEIDHYPPQNFEPFVSNLNNFIFRNFKNNENIILGNGASELIDLTIRSISGSTWKPSKSDTQYLEYDRSSRNTKKIKCKWDNKNTDLTCLVNPTNPTGDYLNVNEMKNYILTNCSSNSHVLVDESMQPWHSANWRSDSLVSQTDWIVEMASKNSIYIYIIHSWTKIFSCTGLRYGSLICPTKEIYNKIQSLKNPWSVNILALKYIDFCINDKKYMEDTWSKTSELRKYQVDKINKHFPNWNCYGESFLSWIWVNTYNDDTALLAYNLCKFNGTPIRLGKFGYKKNTYIRIAVREKKYFDDLLECLIPLKVTNKINIPVHLNINSNIIHSFKYVNVEKIKSHEEYILDRHEKLYNYITSNDNVFNIPAIIVCSNTFIIIDGHHRFSVMKKFGISNIPCLLINYFNDNIIVNFNNEKITKNDVIQAGITSEHLPPKSTRHMLIDNNNNFLPLQVLSPNVLIKIN